MPKQKYYYAIVHKENGGFLLNGSKLPIYWMKRVAVEEAKKWPKYMVQRMLVSDIEEAALMGNIIGLNKLKQ